MTSIWPPGRCPRCGSSDVDVPAYGCEHDWHNGPAPVVAGPEETMHFSGTVDQRPHSRACEWRIHPHGSGCSTNCPTCHGSDDEAVARLAAATIAANTIAGRPAPAPDEDIAQDVDWWRSECDAMRAEITRLVAENGKMRDEVAAQRRSLWSTSPWLDTSSAWSQWLKRYGETDRLGKLEREVSALKAVTMLQRVEQTLRFPRRQLLAAMRMVEPPSPVPVTPDPSREIDVLDIIDRLYAYAGRSSTSTHGERGPLQLLARWFPDVEVLRAVVEIATRNEGETDARDD